MKYCLFIVIILFISCSKENSCKECKDGYVTAKILNTGLVAADGCDWVVRIGADQNYHPDDLKDEFKQHELEVEICYTMASDKFVCGFAAQQMPVIHVADVKK